jgi:hypothetical protein
MQAAPLIQSISRIFPTLMPRYLSGTLEMASGIPFPRLILLPSRIPIPVQVLNQIRLEAMNACGSTFTIKGPIVVVEKPKINAVSINPNPGCAPQLVNFSISATGVNPPNNYSWYFGPPGAEAHNVSSTSYTYTQAGIYDFMVIARNGCGEDTLKTKIYIDTLPVPRIQASPTEGCHALTVNFLNLTQPRVYSSTPFYEELWIDGGLVCGPWWCTVNCPNYGNYSPGLGCGCCAGYDYYSPWPAHEYPHPHL